MLPGSHKYCDVSLPVPLDQPFTYGLPETLRHRVLPGCRLIVPFGSRKLTGIALRCHDEAPAMETRSALRLVDAEPVLDQDLLAVPEGPGYRFRSRALPPSSVEISLLRQTWPWATWIESTWPWATNIGRSHQKGRLRSIHASGCFRAAST